ncbi:MAG: cytochrome P450 [Anaerolineae bacterium]|nr:cytochrome P450 [Anaerolineae bacterium]
MPPRPAGLKGHFLLGNLPEFSADTLAFMLKMREYGDVVKLRFGPFPAYVLNHPDVVHDVLVTNADKHYKSSVTKNVLEPVLGNGIFTSDGEFWRRQRKLVQPAFHTKRIGAYADIITRYAERMLAGWQPGTRLAGDDEMTHLTMRIISKALFDADVASDVDLIGEAIAVVLKNTDERFNQLPTIPYWVPNRINRQLRANIAKLDTLIQRFIDERRASGEDNGDLLSMLLAAQDDDGAVMTDKQVRDEALTLFGAGHETTAVALTWTWYLLSQHPEVEAKLHEELATVLNGRTPTLDDLPKLKYTEMVLKESMRLYPPAWGTTREVIAPTQLGEYALNKGDTVFINIYGMQRDERFFTSALTFDPERFSPEREKSIPRHAYIPFGNGPRVCVGNAFAMMEAKLVLATVAQHFRLELAPGQIVQPQRMFTLRPKYGMDMVVRARAAERVAAAEPLVIHVH